MLLSILICNGASAADNNEQTANSTLTNGLANITISGEVKKCSNGDPFEGATVTVKQNGLQIANTTTSANGSYILNFQSVDRIFNVTALYSGHKPSTKEIIITDGNYSGEADFKLGNNDAYVYKGWESNPSETVVFPDGTIIYGRYSAPNAFTIIEDGTNYASSTYYSTVYIAHGIYNAYLEIYTPMSFCGENQLNTIIMGYNEYGILGIYANDMSRQMLISGLNFTNADYNAIYLYSGRYKIENCTFNNNHAMGFHGGAIYVQSDQIMDITGSNFNNNTADRNGGAIFNNGGYLNVNFCRFYGNSALNGRNIYSTGQTVNAINNWWGTNSGPGTSIVNVDAYTWITLRIDNTDDLIGTGENTNVRVSLKYNSNNEDTSSLGAVPDVNVVLDATLGYLNQYTGVISSGQNLTVTFTAGDMPGFAKVNATVDNETQEKSIHIVRDDVYIATAADGGSDSNNGSSSSPFLTLNRAIADLKAGGRIHIANGTYSGDGNRGLNIDKDMTILFDPWKGAGTSIINAGNAARIFNIAGGINVIIQNLTLTNGAADMGGAINNTGTLHLANCTFTSNVAVYDGGAVYNTGILYIGNCIFTGNSVTNVNRGGGAVCNYFGATSTVLDSNFTNNAASSNSAGAIFSGGSCTVNRCNFTSNSAERYGGAIYNMGGDLVVTDSNFTGNIVTSNSGGAIYNQDGNCIISGNNFTSNTATGYSGYGGAISIWYGLDKTININSNNFINNAANTGSTININHAYPQINFNRFFNNTGSYYVCSDVARIDATNNWWGTNNQTIISSLVSDYVNYSPWIVLRINNTADLINLGENSTVNANLRYNYNGTDYEDTWAVYGKAVPDVNVSFNAALGYLSNLSGIISNGLNATTVFTGTASGDASVNASVDNQTVNTLIQVLKINDVYVATDGNDANGTGSQSNPFQSLAKAIAEVQATGTVHVANGTYSGVKNRGLNITSDMTILFDSWRGFGAAIIDAEHLDRIFNITSGANVTIQNLTIINGNATSGGAIYNTGNCTVNNSTINNNNARNGEYGNLANGEAGGNGGAIYNTGTLTISNTVLTGNKAGNGGDASGNNAGGDGGDGGAIYNTGTLTISNTVFTGNKAGNGGNSSAISFGVSSGDGGDGGAIYNTGTLTTNNTTLTDNTAGIAGKADWETGYAGHGGAIYNYGNLNVTNSTINNNNADGIFNHGVCTVANSTITNNNGDGIDSREYSNCTVTNSTIKNNNGCGISSEYGSNCTVINSIINNNNGGGIFNYGVFTVINSTMNNNTAGNGGGIENLGVCTVTNSTFTQNTATRTGNNGCDGGGGICNNAYCTVTNSTFINNTAYYGGGGICNIGGIFTLYNSTLIQNTANVGGGIYNHWSGIFNVTNSTINNNNATDGGGIFNLYGGNFTVTNSTINDNTASGIYGGGGILNNAYCTVTNSTISNNTANGYGGGGIFNLEFYCTVTNSNISNNNANGTDYGGGGILNTGICTVTNSTINDNIATEGGGILNAFNCTVTNSTMNNNTAGNGGGIYNLQGNLSLNNSTISNNNATQCGSGIYNKYEGNCELIDSTIIYNTASQQGGGIYNNGTCSLFNSIINNNTATDSGGIYNNGNLTVTNSSLINNNATHGGGIFNSGICIIINSSINHNTAAFLGGGIDNYMYGTLTVTNSDISDNIVDYYGGGIYNDYGSNFTITNSTINNNIATNSGGGIYNYQNSNCTVINSTINNNNATNSGGGIYNNIGTCTVTNSIINNNIALYGSGISNQGICIVTNSNIRNNTADYNGGGILNFGTCEVANSTISNNTVKESNPYNMPSFGGGISNFQNSACTITNSTINNNGALYGGGILNAGNCTVTGSTLINNQAVNGSAVYTTSSYTLINFNRIFNNTGSYDVYSTVIGVNATNNWWGTNFLGSNPFAAGRVNENITADPWIVLKLTASPTIVDPLGNSTIIADLTHNSAGDPVAGTLPDGMNVLFACDSLGTITPESSPIITNATTIFTADTTLGDSEVNATVDNAVVTKYVRIGSRDNIYVATDGNDNSGTGSPEHPFQTLVKALAEVQAAGTIHVAKGTYSGSGNRGLNITSDMTILFDSWRGNGTVIIDAEHLDRIFNITSGVNVTLQNLTLINGNATNGGAIYNTGNCTVIDSTITNNSTANNGGGIYNSNGNLNLNNSSITGNTAIFQNGGGIYNNYGNFTVITSTISNNDATYGNGGGIFNSGTCTVTNSIINNSNAYYGGGIWNDYVSTCTVTNSTITGNTAIHGSGGGICNNYGTCTFTNSTINNNTATNNGGAIWTGGSCSFTNSTINNNTALYGGGIYNEGFCNVINSNISNNTADIYGGGITHNYGTCTVTNSTINNNTATYSNGGGIYIGSGTCTVTGSKLTSNQAVTGSVVYAKSSDTLINFNRIFNNTESYDVYSEVAGVNATLNWWGTNFQGTNPFDAGRVNENVTADPWIVLTVTTSRTLLKGNNNCTIAADLLHDSRILTDPNHPNSYYHNPKNGHVPDGIPVEFTTNLGSIITPTPWYMTNGIIQVIFNSGAINGTANLTTTVNNQAINTYINIDTLPPTVSSVDPTNNAVNVPANKIITIIFNEPIKIGTGWIELINSTGTIIPINTVIGTNNITITPQNNLTEDKYTIIIHTNSVQDLAGNPVALWTSKFTSGTGPNITSIDPANKAINVPANKIITVTFNEPIKRGNGWIELISSTGTIIPINTIFGTNNITITPQNNLTEDKYTIIIHTGSITDLLGNLITLWTSKFTSGNGPQVTNVDPANNAINVPRNKNITVTFNEQIKMGTGWIELVDTSGTIIPITTSITGNILTINHTDLLATGTKYKIIIHTRSVTDLLGNYVALWTSTFTTNTT